MQLVQVNVARLVAVPDDPAVAPFMRAVDAVNALGEAHPGFVWRLTDEPPTGGPPAGEPPAGDGQTAPPAGGATGQRWPGAPDDEQVIVNLTVWDSREALHEFVFRSGHAHYLQRRREWFERGSTVTALWWVPDGHRPSLEEAYERTEHLRRHGPTAHAFRLTDDYGPPPG